ncbi:MAG: cupredoxin domain-containing protein [Alphaproteobacteria bacterium]|nr:cupredoxin domain-containing protein [Alphaproteobacteria bacterium]
MKHSHYLTGGLFFILVVSFAISAGTGEVAVAGRTPAAAAAPTRAAKTAAVSIVEPPFQPVTTWSYRPAVLKVRVGATVTWTNTGAVLHTVTATDHKSFDSKDIKPKTSFSFTFKKAGTFPYFCSYHPWMKGTVIVTP